MTNYQKIYETAADNYGLITSAQAKEIGVSDKEMCAISKRNRIRRISYGVYKLVDYIPVEHDIYAEAVTIVGDGAYLYGETVLALLDLCPTNPTRVIVGTDKRVRKKLPSYIKVVKHNEKHFTYYEGIRSQSVGNAILACRKSVMRSRLNDALEKAFKEGLINDKEKTDIQNRLAND